MAQAPESRVPSSSIPVRAGTTMPSLSPVGSAGAGAFTTPPRSSLVGSDVHSGYLSRVSSATRTSFARRFAAVAPPVQRNWMYSGSVLGELSAELPPPRTAFAAHPDDLSSPSHRTRSPVPDSRSLASRSGPLQINTGQAPSAFDREIDAAQPLQPASSPVHSVAASHASTVRPVVAGVVGGPQLHRSSSQLNTSTGGMPPAVLAEINQKLDCLRLYCQKLDQRLSLVSSHSPSPIAAGARDADLIRSLVASELEKAKENLYGRLHSEVVESRASTVTASSVSTATLKPLQDEMDTLRDTVAGLQAHFSEFNRATKVELIQLSRTCAVLTGSAGPSDLPLAKSATGNADSAKLRSAPQDSDAVSSDAVFGISGGGRSGSVLDRLQRLELSLDTTTRASQNDVTALVQRLQRLEAEMQQANSTNSQLSSQQRRLEDLVTAQQQQQNQSDRPSAFVSDQLADVNRTCRDLARASQSATEQLNALSDRLQQVEQQAQQAKNASVSITVVSQDVNLLTDRTAALEQKYSSIDTVLREVSAQTRATSDCFSQQTHASEELKRQVQNLEAELRGLITAQSQVSRPDPSENSAVSSALSASVEQTLKRTDELEQSMRSLQDEQVRLTRALDSRDQRSKSELAELSSTVRLQGAASIAVEQRLDQHDTVIAALQTAQQQLRDALSEVEAKAHASSPAESGVAAAGSATEVARLRGAVEQLMQAQQQSTEASGKAEAVIRQFATRVATVEDSVAAARNGPAAALNVEALQNLHRDLTKLVDTSVSSSQLGAVEQRVAQVEQKQQLAEQSSRATAAAVAEQAATLTAYQEQTRQRADRSDVQLKALTESVDHHHEQIVLLQGDLKSLSTVVTNSVEAAAAGLDGLRTDVARLDASTSELKSETTTLNTNDATQKAQVDAIDQRLRSVERSATVAPAPAATTSTGPPPALMPPASPNSAFAGAHGGVTAPVMISPDMFRAATTPNAARKPPTPTSESMFSPFSLNQPVSSSAPLAPANRKTTMDTLGNLPSPKYANDTAVPQAKATTPSGQIHSHAHTQSQPSVQPPPLQSQTSFSKTQPLSAPPAQSSLHDWDKESSDVNERSEGDGTTAPSLAMGGINPIMLRDDAQQRALRQKQRQIGTLSPINSALIAAGPATPAVPAKVDSAQPASSATAVNRVDSPEQFSALAASPNRSLGTSEFDTDDGGDVELDLGDRSATPDVIRKLSAMPRNPRPVALPTAFGTTAPLGAFGRGNASGSSFTSPLMAPLGASNMANATMRTPVTSSLAGLGAPTAKPSGDEAKTRTRSPPGALASLGDIVTDGGSGEDVTDLSDDAAFDGSDIELDLGLAPKPTNYRLAGIGTHSTVAATTTAAAASVPLSTAPNLLTFGSLSSDGRKLSANSAAPPSGNLSRAISGSGGSGSIALAKSTSNLSAGASESAAEFPAFSSAVTSGRPSVKLGTSSSVTPVSEINEPARIGIDRPATRVSLGNLSPVSGSGAAHTPGGHSVNGLQIDAEDIMEDDSELDFPMTP